MLRRPWRFHRSRADKQAGFLLLEALISILLFSLGIITLMGLQALSIKDAQQSRYRNEASYLANSIIAQMMTDQVNFSGYDDDVMSAPRRLEWDDEVADALPNGSTSIEIDDTTVTVVVGWQAPEETTSHNHIAIAQVVF